MDTQNTALPPLPAPDGLLVNATQTYLAGRSQHTMRAYQTRLQQFMDWYQAQPPAHFVAHLKNYIIELQNKESRGKKLSPRTVQAHINTIKGLLKTAAALDESGQLAAALPTLDLAKAPPVRGDVQGNRISDRQRQILLAMPETKTNKGRRDTAILALMAVSGLRRSEIASLNWEHITELDGHKVIQNLVGKHGRVRTVYLPPRLWRRIQRWGTHASIDKSPDAPVFVAIRKGDHIQHGQRITSSAVAYLVERYTKEASRDGIAPHDLRRTAAKLMRESGAPIEQVQTMLGHASPQTTSAYIGETLDLDDQAKYLVSVKVP